MNERKHDLYEQILQSRNRVDIRMLTKVKSLNTVKNLINKKCGKCGWQTFSWISFNYVYCPKCQGLLKEFDMRIE